MRKTFKFFCAAVVSALAVSSCYDDSKLWEGLEGLEQRVAALEEKLNSEVQTINSTLGALKAADEKLAADIAAVVADVKKANEVISKLDAADGTINGRIDDLQKALSAFETETEKKIAEVVAQVAVTKVEKNAAGNYVLTFADGNTLEVAAAAASANTGVVTTVEVEGVTYWAVIGADGKTTVLDATVHPDTKLAFKVDPKSYEVLVTYNGTDWESTGVVVKDVETINVVTDFKDGKDFVTITVGGVEYKLPKVSTNTFDIVSGMVFFANGETKSIPVEMNGVVSSMVAKVPTGWIVDVTSEGLIVTAPASEESEEEEDEDDYLPDMGVSLSELSIDAEPADYGMIEVWVVTEDGKTFVGKLQVSLNGKFADIKFTTDEENGVIVNVTVPKSDTPTDMDMETGELIYGPVYFPVLFGACPADEFYLCVLPLQSYKSTTEYTFDDLFVYKSIKIDELVYGGTADVQSEIAGVDYTNFRVKLTSPNADQIIYNFWSTTEYNEIIAGLEEDLTIVDYMLDNFRGNFMLTESSTVTISEDANFVQVQRGTSYTVVAFAIDSDGKVGAATTLPVTTLDLPYRDEITVNVISATFDPNNQEKVTVTFAVEGATKVALYKNMGDLCLSSYYSGESFVAGFEMKLVEGSQTFYWKEIAVVDGVATIELDDYATGNSYIVYTAYNVDENNKVTTLARATRKNLNDFLN